MAHRAGESESSAPRLTFDRRLKLEFHGASVTSDAGLLAYRELDDALGLTALAGAMLLDGRRGKNTRHFLSRLLRHSVFGRLAGYEDVNDADRLVCDPAMRWIVGRPAVTKQAASASQIGRFENEWLARDDNLSALVDFCGRWIGRVHACRPPKAIVLDMGSSVSPTYGEQEGGHLQWAVRLQVLSPAVRVQSVQRSGTLRASIRQRPFSRWLARRFGARGRALQEA